MENYLKYLNRKPTTIKAAGELQGQDGKRLAVLYFTTFRDIITDPGISASENCPELIQEALCAACACMEGRAVMSADLITPDQICGKLGWEETDERYYAALMAVLAVKNSLSSYASYRKENGA
ncbi:MAG: hypothetical protein ACI4WR_03335 [Bulleidia sp.]